MDRRARDQKEGDYKGLHAEDIHAESGRNLMPILDLRT